MAPSKRWMDFADRDRLHPIYTEGIEEFLKFAFDRTGEKSTISCPCVDCCNSYSGTRDSIREHLIVRGMMKSYRYWYHHGERFGEPQSDTDEEDADELKVHNANDDVREIMTDFFPTFFNVDRCDESSIQNVLPEIPNDDAKKFYRLLADYEQPLYPGSKCSKLTALVKLLHIKSLGRWSNKSFTMLLHLLKEDLLPPESTLPDSYEEAKKIIRDFGLYYKKIDACPNHCMLYWKEEEKFDSCRVCGASRWMGGQDNGKIKFKKSGKKIPLKTLRYFPLKPRLQRMFMSTKIAAQMRWHHDKRIEDGIMRHPSDSKAWKEFDRLHSSFASDSRNVRLGLASDGFQPFTHAKGQYSIWPVFIIPYNLPPWMCMKQENFILSMIIPGPEGPGDAIDIYLSPLIEELKELWEIGVDTYDASAGQNFNLRAALLWTINDFPAYGNLSGWSTKGRFACPCCNKDTHSLRLPNGGKQCYMGHRRYLPINHRWRYNKASFDGTKEFGLAPKQLSGDDILTQVKGLEGISMTKAPNMKTKISHFSRGDNWNKKSIFFELPYWRTLLLRHNLDVMHIEKNICDNVLGTIMDIKGKTKDNIKSRFDLQEMGIRKELHPIEMNDKFLLPAASYTLSPEEKLKFCQILKEIKVPDGFLSNISQCINLKERKISGLKSHDCHILLQRLIPLAIRGLLPKKVSEPLMELSMFFMVLCSKSLNHDELDQIEAQIPLTLCKLEMIFPPSFFDVMLHLPVHLAYEAKICGPVQFRWMYPIERRLYGLKALIRNRARPEGSIAEGYIADECMTLCSRYLQDIETKFNRPDRNDDNGNDELHDRLSIFSQSGRPLGAASIRDLHNREWEQAHIYVLKNCSEVQPFIEEYETHEGTGLLQSRNEDWDKNFIKWFRNKVETLHKEDPNQVNIGLLSLARGPYKSVKCYNGYIINGLRFHTEEHDNGLKTQNSGITVVGNTGTENKDIDYYGVLTEIFELGYVHQNSVALFRCKWWDVHNIGKGVKVDEYGFISINSQRLIQINKINEPFVLAAQASHVFYVRDTIDKGWYLVVKTQPRELYDMPDDYMGDEVEAYQEGKSFKIECRSSTSSVDDEIKLSRKDVEPMKVDAPSALKKKRRLEVETSSGD